MGRHMANMIERSIRGVDAAFREITLTTCYSGIQVCSVPERLACWTQAQKGLGSNRSRYRVTVLSKLFTSIVPLFTKQRNW